jgi:hypothetical protein
MRREARLGFEGEMQTMTQQNTFYYPYAFFTNAHFPLFKVGALYFDKLVILDPVGASWVTTGADRFNFRNRVNYDYFPLNENQRRIHFNRSYDSTMIGIYYYNSRPTVIRVGAVTHALGKLPLV